MTDLRKRIDDAERQLCDSFDAQALAMSQPDIIDREANTREEAVRWAADMITEIKRLRREVKQLRAEKRKGVWPLDVRVIRESHCGVCADISGGGSEQPSRIRSVLSTCGPAWPLRPSASSTISGHKRKS